MSPKGIIYVDESGNSGLKSWKHNNTHPFFIMGFCYCGNPKIVNRKLRKLLTKLHKKKMYPTKLKEIKFYPSSSLEKLGYSKQEIQDKWEQYFPLVRQETAKIICKYSDNVFAGVLDKRTVWKKTWTSEHIGNFLFNKSLFDNILPDLNLSSPPSVIYDRGRLSPDKTKLFNQYMLDTDSVLDYFDSKKYDGNLLNFHDVDSLKMPGIWLADFIAGSFHQKFKYDNSVYYDLIKSKIIRNGSLNLWF